MIKAYSSLLIFFCSSLFFQRTFQPCRILPYPLKWYIFSLWKFHTFTYVLIISNHHYLPSNSLSISHSCNQDVHTDTAVTWWLRGWPSALKLAIWLVPQEAFYVSHYKPYQSPLLGDHTTYCFVLVNDETGFAISLINKRYLINVYSFVTQ